jgi:hypothetical protein
MSNLPEAQRLLVIAGASLPKLRVLTVICAKDHTLITVYRITGVLVWKGSGIKPRTVTRSTPWDDSDEACSEGIIHEGGRRDIPIKQSKLDPQQRFAIVDTFDQTAGLYGNCPCGSFQVDPEWLTGQLGRKDLPTSRRVIHKPSATYEIR